MMVRHHIFGRLPGIVGILTGLTMLVPANAGPVGLTIAMVSLLPTAAWLILLIPNLLRVARETPTGHHHGPVTATDQEYDARRAGDRVSTIRPRRALPREQQRAQPRARPPSATGPAGQAMK